MLRHKELRVLDLSENQIGQPGAEAVASLLAYINDFRELHLRGNMLGDEAIVSICDVAADALALEVLAILLFFEQLLLYIKLIN